MTDIQNIIFDFGGVIYDIDFERSMIEFQKLGLDGFESLYSQAIQDRLFEKLESDLISPQEFRSQLKQMFETEVTEAQIDFAWNALLVGFKKERLDLIAGLKTNYSIYLLSNTNQIHYDVFSKEFQEITGFNSFNELFVKAYLSFEMGCRKPDPIIYRKVLDDAKIDPSETLFIDDSFQNLKPARELGIQTCFLDSNHGEQLTDLFKENKLKQDLVFNWV